MTRWAGRRKPSRILFLLAACTIACLTTPSQTLAGVVQLPRTGQTGCWDASGTSISCSSIAAKGMDGAILAGAAWPTLRFIDNGNNTVTDTMTGLVWPKDVNFPGLTWQAAQSYVANMTLGGYTDWRLPTVNELQSLVNLQIPNQEDWLNAVGNYGNPFTNVHGYFYWSSTTAAALPGYAWMVNMHYGDVNMFSMTEPTGLYFWPVRGPINQTAPAQVWQTGQSGSAGVAWATPRFTDNGNGSVRDNVTGLVWLKKANCMDPSGGVDKSTAGATNGEISWSDSLLWSNGLASGTCGLSDGSTPGQWRLPNREELYSLIDFSKYGPSFPSGHPFENLQSCGYWTSTTEADYPANGWAISFLDSDVNMGNKAHLKYAWAVRNGCTAPPPGMVGWWPLDSASSAPSIVGTYTSAPEGSPTPITGQVANALEFNGSSQVRATNASLLNIGVTSFSVDAWVKPTDVSGVRTIVDKRGAQAAGGSGEYGYHVYLYDGRLGIRLADGSAGNNFGGTNYYVPVNMAIGAGSWHFVGVSVDRISHTITFRVDGTPFTQPFSYWSTSGNHPGSLANTADLLIGGHHNAYPGGSAFVGGIDEVEIFNRALGDAEMANIFASGAEGKCKNFGSYQVNNPPVVTGAPPTSCTAGISYTFTPSVSDLDSSNLTYSVVNKPAWATFDTATGTLSGTPVAGTYGDIVILVSDGITITPLPVFTITVAASGGTQVPVMEGWWLLSGALAGMVGLSRRTRK